MEEVSREFQIFAKPVGPQCNLDCQYCYYLDKKHLYQEGKRSFHMSNEVLERYIIQHIQASTEKVIQFCWHGGEPTLYGLDSFRKIIDLQRKHLHTNQRIVNGIQTNGTLLDEQWCRFLAEENFAVGLSLDGPRQIHDTCRLTHDKQSSFDKALLGYDLLRTHGVQCEILCAVNSYNVRFPLEVYEFFRTLEAPYLSYIPVVNLLPQGEVCPLSVPAKAWGEFLCGIFDVWVRRDIGKVKVQIFEEAARTAFGQEHTLCVFKETCGNCPVIEHNGDFYSCDHFVNTEHCLGNISQRSITEMLDSPTQKAFGDAKLKNLPDLCLQCDVRAMCNGGCLKHRFIHTPQGWPGLNYLCEGYKRFFSHCRPFVSAVSAQWRRQQAAGSISTSKVKRNEPCPCGSGKKYKQCCMRT